MVTPPPTRHEWYQNDTRVYISIFAKKVSADAVEVTFEPQALSVCLALPAGGNYVLDLDPLAGEIDPTASGYEVLSTKVEIYLQKKLTGIQWTSLEAPEGNTSAPAPAMNTSSNNPAPPAYPSSAARKAPVNWDRLAREAEQDPENKAEGDQALNELFQTIYKDASDETKRAMMKSYVESNGTCLSTDWEKVGQGTVETQPPEGMTAKKY
ncbi:Cochaperone protein [Tieghemiomyces parasiticus]|uniref:Cochaperone protein n=1 Tax=Tieghemiomyces parasiticus TaxID=78921 RepID=A0A9W8DNN6_9FUNG|nr:Cochaperone protein [Tieghemiomyces parasiticus]